MYKLDRKDTRSLHDVRQAIHIPWRECSNVIHTNEALFRIGDQAWLRAALSELVFSSLTSSLLAKKPSAYNFKIWYALDGFLSKSISRLHFNGFTVWRRNHFLRTPLQACTCCSVALFSARNIFQTAVCDVVDLRKKLDWYQRRAVNAALNWKIDQVSKNMALSYDSPHLFLEHTREQEVNNVWRRKDASWRNFKMISLPHFWVSKEEKEFLNEAVTSTGRRYLLSGKSESHRPGILMCVENKALFLAFFFISNGREKRNISVREGSDHYIFYPVSEKRNLANVF